MAVSAAITPSRPGEYGRSAGLLTGAGAGAGAAAAAAGAAASVASGLWDAPCEDAGSVLLVDIVALLGPLSERLGWFRSGSMTGIPDEWRAHPTAKLPHAAGRTGIRPPGGTGRARAGVVRVGRGGLSSASVAAVSAPLPVAVDRVENQADDHGA